MNTQPAINEKSKRMLEKKKKLLEEEPTLTKNRSQNEIQKKRLASPSHETFKPSISKKSQAIAESKRQGQKIEDHLLL
jgi:hypothetical protein